jgi:segregation and condensation protein B
MNGDPKAILEALLFVAEEPVSLDKLKEILDAYSRREIAAFLEELRASYEGRGLQLVEVAGGYRLATRPELAPWIRKLQTAKPARLSRAALETLAIIAYRQPITRPEIEAIRGVTVDGVLKTLTERDLIRILGRKPEPGRPLLYGTSRAFLEYFGFKDLSELPALREIEELVAEPGPSGEGEEQPASEVGSGSEEEDLLG